MAISHVSEIIENPCSAVWDGILRNQAGFLWIVWRVRGIHSRDSAYLSWKAVDDGCMMTVV
jgi:hypothetical protein